MLAVWGRKNSINVQNVLWCCAELGLEFERIDAGLHFGVNTTPEYKRMNPNGLVPTLDDSGYILWESNVIVRYLASTRGLGTLCPADAKERFLSERWMDWQITAAGPLGIVYRGLIRTPPEKRDDGAIAAAQGRAEALFRILDAHLAGRDFVESDRFTIGDIPTGAIVYRWLVLGNSRDAFPNVARYHDRMAERPGFREHVMLPPS
jgi:glutathione S-transferase